MRTAFRGGSLLSLLLILLSSWGCADKPLLSGINNPQDAETECARFYLKKDYEQSIQCYELLKSRFVGTAESIEADIYIADNYFRQKEFLVAAESYVGFVKIHPTHPKLDYVTYRAGLSYLKASPKAVDRDQEYLDDALAYLDASVYRYPGSAYEPVSREKREETRLRMGRRQMYVGQFYYKTKEYVASIPRFQEVTDHYADLGLDEKAYYTMGLAYLKLSQKGKALKALEALETKYPASRYRKKLARKLGVS
ncbi:MAG: outer membrane protein assembly factor BamD [bacterium]|nr:outer membrane protein assembly factor BamD [bacterium]